MQVANIERHAGIPIHPVRPKVRNTLNTERIPDCQQRVNSRSLTRNRTRLLEQQLEQVVVNDCAEPRIYLDRRADRVRKSNPEVFIRFRIVVTANLYRNRERGDSGTKR